MGGGEGLYREGGGRERVKGQRMTNINMLKYRGSGQRMTNIHQHVKV